MSSKPTMLTIKEAADAINLSEYCIRTWCLSGKLKHVKAGRKYLINQKVLFDFIGENPPENWQ